MVVDLAIENKLDRAATPTHGLVPTCQVDDSEAPMPESNCFIAIVKLRMEDSLIVRAPMGKRLRHCAKRFYVMMPRTDIPCNTAHNQSDR